MHCIPLENSPTNSPSVEDEDDYDSDYEDILEELLNNKDPIDEIAKITSMNFVSLELEYQPIIIVIA